VKAPEEILAYYFKVIVTKNRVCKVCQSMFPEVLLTCPYCGRYFRERSDDVPQGSEPRRVLWTADFSDLASLENRLHLLRIRQSPCRLHHVFEDCAFVDA